MLVLIATHWAKAFRISLSRSPILRVNAEADPVSSRNLRDFGGGWDQTVEIDTSG